MTSETTASQEAKKAPAVAGQSPVAFISPRTARKVCVLVLGMHRSGTSAFARMANLLGCDLPKNLMGGSEGNSIGHWESNAVVTLDDQLLISAGTTWDDWLALNEAWNNSPLRSSFLQRAATVLAEEYGASPLFVLKDPRICRIAPFWFEALEAFGADVVVAMPIRNPLEVAASLAERDGSEKGRGLLLWLRNVLDAEHASRGKPRHVFGYEDMLSDWSSVGAQMERATGVIWPRQTALAGAEIDAFLIEDAHHQKIGREKALGPRTPLWVRQAYAILSKWCKEGERSEDYAELDRIRGEFDSASPTFAQLILEGTGAGEGVGEWHRKRLQLEAEVDRLTRDQSSGRQAVEWEAQISQLSDALRRSQEEALEARDALSVHEQQLQQVAAGFEAQVSQLSSGLRQREEEAAQAWAELAVEKRTQEMLRAELERRDGNDKDLYAKLEKLQQRLDERTQEFFASEARGLEARWEAKEAGWRADRSNEAALSVKAELSKLQGQLSEALSRVERQEREIAQMVQFQMQLEQSVGRPSGSEFSLTAGSDMDGERAAERVARQHGEIAELTRMAAEETNRAQDLTVGAMWLRELNALQQCLPRWWGLLPSAQRKKRLLEKVEKAGLFDSAAYYSQHSDVAQSGMDALDHYVQHGIFEGRTW